MTVGPDGRRLAKRDGALKLATLREAGVDPKHLVGWLARSCGWTDEVIPSTPHDWLGRFDLSSLPRTPWTIPADLLVTKDSPKSHGSGNPGKGIAPDG